jgi:hypothetical protein
MKLAKITLNQSLSIPKQRLWLLGVLLITVLATIWTAIFSEEPVSEDAILAKPTLIKEAHQQATNSNTVIRKNMLKQPTSPNKTIASNMKPSQAFQLTSRSYSPTVKNMFGIQTWVPPLTKKELEAQQAQQKQLASQPPVAPPLPFKYVGKIEEEDNIKYFLLQQNKLINIEIGQLVDAQWRLISEDAQYLNWIYVPFDQPKSLTK